MGGDGGKYKAQTGKAVWGGWELIWLNKHDNQVAL